VKNGILALVALPVALGLLCGLLVARDPYLLYQLVDRDTRQLLYITSLPFPIFFAVLAPLGALALLQLVRHAVAIFDWILEQADLIVLFGFFVSHQLNSFALGPLDPTDLMAGIGMLLLALRMIAGKPVPASWSPQLIVLLLMVTYLIWGLSFHIGGATAVARSIKAVFLFFIFLCFPLQRNCRDRLIKWLLVLLPVSALFCIFQEVVYLGTGVLIIGPIDKDKLSTMFEFGIFRVCGFTNFYTVYGLAAGSFFLMTYALTIFRNSLVTGRTAKLLCWFSLAVSGVAIGLTTAKDIWIGCTVGVVVLSCARFWRLTPVAVPAALLATAGCLIYLAMMPGRDHFVNYLIKDVKRMEEERIILDRYGIEAVVAASPGRMLFGSGPNTAGRLATHPRNWPPHNAFIMSAVEGGIVCAFLLMIFYVWALFRCIQIILIGGDDTTRALGWGYLTAWGVIFFYSNFQTTYLDPFIASFFGLIEITAIQMLARLSRVDSIAPIGVPAYDAVLSSTSRIGRTSIA
jgi:hypothetical protein